ncbi:hypothetical protein [Paenarthrobacter ilicis]|uniref:hypothetical protein n=1 Tax=Paenarthrobacter ilicis TaxID=43665 RepID=UPI003867A811
MAGEATLQPVADTSGSWVRETPHEQSVSNAGAGQMMYTFADTSAFDSVEADHLYGYVLLLADCDEERRRE